MIKSLVGRVTGRKDTAQKSGPSAAAQGQTHPQDSAQSGKTASVSPAAEPIENKQSGQSAGRPKGKNNRGRRSNKSKAPENAWSIEQFAVDPKEGETRFHDLGLHDEIMHGIADLGFKYCSPIQASVLPHTLQGNDAIGKAQTGTGKTAAFLITIFDDLLRNPIEGERFICEQIGRAHV